MKKFYNIFHLNNFDEKIINELTLFYENLDLTKLTKNHIKDTLTGITKLKKKYPKINLHLITTNFIENFFSLIKSKFKYPTALQYSRSVSNIWTILTILLKKDKKINIPCDFISTYYNLLDIQFINALDLKIIKNFKTSNYKLTMEQTCLLYKYRPNSKTTGLHSKFNNREIMVTIPCLFGDCHNTTDFKHLSGIIKHLETDHQVPRNLSSPILKDLIEFSINKFNKRKLKDEFCYLTTNEITPYYQKLKKKIEENKNKSDTKIINIENNKIIQNNLILNTTDTNKINVENLSQLLIKKLEEPNVKEINLKNNVIIQKNIKISTSELKNNDIINSTNQKNEIKIKKILNCEKNDDKNTSYDKNEIKIDKKRKNLFVEEVDCKKIKINK
jgi:hypothetical protein